MKNYYSRANTEKESRAELKRSLKGRGEKRNKQRVKRKVKGERR